MDLLNWFGSRGKSLPMSEAMTRTKNDPAIRVVDVRTPQEYREGHIPGSLNVPLDRLQDLSTSVPDKTTAVFVYCLSGSRSGMAAGALSRMGYTDVTNIGGIGAYSGKLER